jgi:BirA family transcriptional regulator, biotin operon repressor / biotin---[acetyl-CoA-carboxylase] ligase
VDFDRYVAELERGRARAGAAGWHGGDNLVVLARTVSTNRLARTVAAEFESEGLDLAPMLVLALEQSGGRGRQGRSWSSPRGLGVYATLVRLYAAPEPLPSLPLLVGVGICRALAPHLPYGCRLKWPNDLLVPTAGVDGSGEGEGPGAHDGERRGARESGGGQAAPRTGRKIGGVLIEALVHPGDGCVALIGFGVNHGQRRDELPAGATSLLLETGGHLGGGLAVGLGELTWDLVAGVERELEHAGDLAYAVAEYRRLLIHQPGDRLVCRVGQREIEGTFAGIDDLGRLRLRRPAAALGTREREPREQEEEAEEVAVSAGEVIEQ